VSLRNRRIQACLPIRRYGHEDNEQHQQYVDHRSHIDHRLMLPAASVDCHAGTDTCAPPKVPLHGWQQKCSSYSMLHWSLIFLIIAIIAGILGFTGIAGAAMGIAKILFFVFLVIWLLVLLVVRRAV
jgi:uncharacterized membrane protein YtjA (UPF0391 family)